MSAHPSGRPIRPHIVKRAPEPTSPRTGYVNNRLNDEPATEELPGGFGFTIYRTEPDDTDDDGPFETLMQ